MSPLSLHLLICLCENFFVHVRAPPLLSQRNSVVLCGSHICPCWLGCIYASSMAAVNPYSLICVFTQAHMDTSVHQEEYERVVKRIRKLEDEDDTAEADMKKVLREELVELRKKENWLRDLLYPRGTATLFAECICVSFRRQVSRVMGLL